MQGSRQVLRLTALAAVFVLGATASALGQGATGTISGTVKDAQGGVVPGATVTIISDTRGTLLAPVITGASGDFVVPNITADTYTVQIEMPSFRTLRRAGIAVSSGSIIALGTITIDVGGTTEVVSVVAETPLVQTASGERSFTVTTESVANLPLQGRTFEQLLSLAPGVVVTPGELNPATRAGGGGGANYMLDGATAMDPGINRPATRISVESLAEVRLVTSTYQAEYARSAGLQINAVTKSGTNQFRGSVYEALRNSKWNSNRKTNIVNGDPKPNLDQMDYGFSIGGPVGRPGGQNKLFFYFNLEANPRSFGGDVNRYRVPTELERLGDFSQSLDNNGNPYPFIKDPLIAGTCSAADTRACFQDGGVLGRIPANRLYDSGINILKWWPTPNINQPRGQAYNYESIDPEFDILGLSARHPRRLPADAEHPRQLQVPRVSAAEQSSSRHDSRVQRHAGARLRDLAASRDVQLDPRPDDVLRSVVRCQLPPPGRLLDHRRRAQLLPHRPERHVRRQPQSVRLRQHSANLPECHDPRPEHVHVLGPQSGRHDDVGRHADRRRRRNSRGAHAWRTRRTRMSGPSGRTRASPAARTSFSTRATAPGTPA